MMSAALLRNTRALTRNITRQTFVANARFFSAEPGSLGDKPLIPGIGMGKTSTGLVRLMCHVNCLCRYGYIDASIASVQS